MPIKVLRSLLFDILFYVTTAFLCLVCLPSLLLPRKVTVWLMRLWASIVMGLLRFVVGLKYTVKGLENLPKGPVIIASKHQSAWDTIIFFLLLEDPALILKQELTRIPIFNLYIKKTKMIALDREAGIKAIKNLIGSSKQVLDSNRPIVIFPEGTRSVHGAQTSYQGGISTLYRDLKVPVIPVALNSGLFWGRRSFIKYPGCITLEFLPAIEPDLSKQEFMQCLESRIENACHQLDRIEAKIETKVKAKIETKDGKKVQPIYRSYRSGVAIVVLLGLLLFSPNIINYGKHHLVGMYLRTALKEQGVSSRIPWENHFSPIVMTHLKKSFGSSVKLEVEKLFARQQLWELKQLSMEAVRMNLVHNTKKILTIKGGKAYLKTVKDVLHLEKGQAKGVTIHVKDEQLHCPKALFSLAASDKSLDFTLDMSEINGIKKDTPLLKVLGQNSRLWVQGKLVDVNQPKVKGRKTKAKSHKKLIITKISYQSGLVIVTLEGEVTFAPDGSINGKLATNIKNYKELVSRLVKAQYINSLEGFFARFGGNFLAGFGSSDLALPLVITNGHMTLGPVSLGKI